MNENLKILEMLKHAQNAPCILCGRLPVKPVMFGDATRIMAYGLCRRCSGKPGAMDKAEAIVRKQSGGN